MTADSCLQTILAREAVDTSLTSPVRGVQAALQPMLNEWAGSQLRSVQPSGSFAKGTANPSGTDIDLFASLKSNTTNALKELYTRLFNKLKEKGYTPKQQNVSINVRVGAYDVDVVPAKHQGGNSVRSLARSGVALSDYRCVLHGISRGRCPPSIPALRTA
jgi:tRNA nucleotidyltransferase (CCA-adding enzyme)